MGLKPHSLYECKPQRPAGTECSDGISSFAGLTAFCAADGCTTFDNSFHAFVSIKHPHHLHPLIATGLLQRLAGRARPGDKFGHNFFKADDPGSEGFFRHDGKLM